MRELGFTTIKTRVYSPWPYVSNSSQLSYVAGWASADPPETLNLFEEMTMVVEGIESTFLLSQDTFKDWFQDASQSYAKLLFADTSRSGFWNYVLATTEDSLHDEDTGNDITQFLRGTNALYGYDQLSDWRLSLADLQTAAIIDFLSPMNLYRKRALFQEYKSFKTFSPSFLQFKGVTFFPDWSAHISPFGLYWQIDLWLKQNNHVSRYFININSGLFKAKIRHTLRQSFKIIAATGYKSQGYVTSYPLKEGLFFQAGVSVDLLH
ncbi:MAG: hypothetical protein VW378_02975 [bacterium]